MSNVVIRQATTDDALEIAGVHHLSRSLAYHAILSPELLNAQTLADREKYWKEQGALGSLADSEIYVAEDITDVAPQIVGFIVLFKHTDPGSLESGERERENHADSEIDRIYVHPDFMGKGVGKALMAHALERLRTFGCKKVCLWVFEENRTARGFYEVMGFSTDGKRRQIKPYPHDVLYTRAL